MRLYFRRERREPNAFESQCIDFLLKNQIDSYDLTSEVLELNLVKGKKHSYFCSVGVLDDKSYEVFEIQHGAEVDEKGFYLTDGELWQYRVFTRLGDALNFAHKCLQKGRLPRKPLRVW